MEGRRTKTDLIADRKQIETAADSSRRTEIKPEEARAPVSAVPPENVWEAKTKASLVHKKKSKQQVRPPPGLAPPPGFASLADRKPDGMNADAAPFPGPRHNSDVATARGRPLQISGTTRIGRSFSDTSLASSDPKEASQPSSPVVDALEGTHQNNPLDAPPIPTPSLSANEGFDVLAFLDDILNEGSTSADDGGAIMEATSDNSRTAEQPFSPNPWATSSSMYQSRAAAYGISIEDETIREPDPIDLPLLTPEAILSSSIGQDEKEDKEGDAISFYADLLGE